MRHQPVKPDFNKEWAKSVGKDEFVKHFTPIYPDVDLKAEWDKISPPEKPQSKKDEK